MLLSFSLIIYQKDAMSQIINENDDLQWWFEDVEKSFVKLVDAAKGCLSGDEQMFVF